MCDICNKCGKEMINLGNIDDFVFCTYPQSWNETYVCHLCKTKKTKIVSDPPAPMRNSGVDGYTDITKSIFEDDPDFEYVERTRGWRRKQTTEEQDIE